MKPRAIPRKTPALPKKPRHVDRSASSHLESWYLVVEVRVHNCPGQGPQPDDDSVTRLAHSYFAAP